MCCKKTKIRHWKFDAVRVWTVLISSCHSVTLIAECFPWSNTSYRLVGAFIAVCHMYWKCLDSKEIMRIQWGFGLRLFVAFILALLCRATILIAYFSFCKFWFEFDFLSPSQCCWLETGCTCMEWEDENHCERPHGLHKAWGQKHRFVLTAK